MDTQKDSEYLTVMEHAVIYNILNNEYANAGTENDPCWSFCATEPIYNFAPKQLRGALSSLIKKGLVRFQDEGEDSMVWLTELGIKTIQNNSTNSRVKNVTPRISQIPSHIVSKAKK